MKVTLIESQKILGAFDPRLQSYAEKKFNERKNFTLVKGMVTEVLPNGVKLKDGTFLPCGLVVWSTGLAPREFTKKLDVAKNKQGQVNFRGVKKFFEPKMSQNLLFSSQISSKIPIFRS